MIQAHFGSMKAWELKKRNVVFRYSDRAKEMMDETDPNRDRLMIGMGGVTKWEGKRENRREYVEVAVEPLFFDEEKKVWRRAMELDSAERWHVRKFYVSDKPLQTESFESVSVQTVQRNKDGDLLVVRDISAPKLQFATAG